MTPPIDDSPTERPTVHVVVKARRRFTPVIDVTLGQRYALTASGSWYDAFIRTDVQGYASWPLQRRFERSRLCPDQPWFALCGVIGAPGASDASLREAVRTQALPWTAKTRAGEPWRAPASGQLYVFPNDVYRAFWNNYGKIDVAVTPLSGDDT